MAIYLDANVIIPWRPLAHLERVAMSIAARKLGQEIVIPSMASDEAEAHLVRSLKGAATDLGAAQRVFNQLFDQPALDEVPPDIGGIVSDWNKSLIELFTVRTHPPGAAEEALRREVLRQVPARATYDNKGKEDGATGARDALIWLTVLEDLRQRDESGHFISKNKDFVRNGHLRPELQAEIPEGLELTGYAGAFEFLKLLGEHQPLVSVTTEELEARVAPTIRRLMPLTNVIPKAVFGSASGVDWIYENEIHDLTPLRIRAVRRWEGESEALTVVDSEWNLTVTAGRMPRFSDGPPEIFEELRLAGTIQLYLPDEKGEQQLAQIVSGRFVVLPEDDAPSQAPSR